MEALKCQFMEKLILEFSQELACGDIFFFIFDIINSKSENKLLSIFIRLHDIDLILETLNNLLLNHMQGHISELNFLIVKFKSQ